jgi:hypothetical protein
MMPSSDPLPPSSPPPPSSSPWFIASGVIGMVLGTINLVTAALTDCMGVCERDIASHADKAAHDFHLAAFNMTLAVFVFTGGGIALAKNRVGAGLVAACALADLSYYGIMTWKNPMAMPLAAMALAGAVVSVVAILRRTLSPQGD